MIEQSIDQSYHSPLRQDKVTKEMNSNTGRIDGVPFCDEAFDPWWSHAARDPKKNASYLKPRPLTSSHAMFPNYMLEDPGYPSYPPPIHNQQHELQQDVMPGMKESFYLTPACNDIGNGAVPTANSLYSAPRSVNPHPHPYDLSDARPTSKKPFDVISSLTGPTSILAEQQTCHTSLACKAKSSPGQPILPPRFAVYNEARRKREAADGIPTSAYPTAYETKAGGKEAWKRPISSTLLQRACVPHEIPHKHTQITVTPLPQTLTPPKPILKKATHVLPAKDDNTDNDDAWKSKDEETLYMEAAEDDAVIVDDVEESYEFVNAPRCSDGLDNEHPQSPGRVNLRDENRADDWQLVGYTEHRRAKFGLPSRFSKLV